MKQYKKEVTATVTMHSGAEIDLHNPNVENVHIEDIAHHLARICRWNGLCDNFYSVAEHSVMTAELAPEEKRLGVLMHDCEEAVLGDNITPLKEMFPPLAVLGNQIRDLILRKFSIPYDHKAVKRYDHEQLLWELDNIINSSDYKGLPPATAERLFLQKYYEYSGYAETTSNINSGVLKCV